jgi:hypothetical protein
MKTARRQASPRKNGILGALAGRRAADSHARALASTIRQLMAAGFSQRKLAGELNQKGVPAPRGGQWHCTSVVRLLTRLGLVTPGNGRTNQRVAVKQAADARAKVLASTIRKLRKAGFVSLGDIARELDKRRVPTARSGKWHRGTVRNLLLRLEKPETARRRRASSSSRPRR